MQRAMIALLALGAALFSAAPLRADASELQLPTMMRALTFDIAATDTPYTQTQLVPARVVVAAATGAAAVPRVSQDRYAFAIEDGRAFWYAAGAAAVTSLGSAVLVGLPYLIVAVLAGTFTALLGPIPLALTVIGLTGGFMVLNSAVSALAGQLVFNSMSRTYETSYWSAFGGHFAGNVAALGGGALIFGLGIMLYTGIEGLSGFTGATASTAVLLFSVLGTMPAAVIGAIAIIAVPALFSAWAMSVAAQPKQGFAIDPSYRASTRDPADPVARAVAPSARDDQRVRPQVAILIPGT